MMMMMHSNRDWKLDLSLFIRGVVFGGIVALVTFVALGVSAAGRERAVDGPTASLEAFKRACVMMGKSPRVLKDGREGCVDRRGVAGVHVEGASK
jgi:hypothetical protein